MVIYQQNGGSLVVSQKRTKKKHVQVSFAIKFSHSVRVYFNLNKKVELEFPTRGNTGDRNNSDPFGFISATHVHRLHRPCVSISLSLTCYLSITLHPGSDYGRNSVFSHG